MERSTLHSTAKCIYTIKNYSFATRVLENNLAPARENTIWVEFSITNRYFGRKLVIHFIYVLFIAALKQSELRAIKELT